jgi:hypothetical protein
MVAGVELGQRDIDVRGMVSRHDTGASAVGDDGQALAARPEVREQRRRRGVHLADVGQAHHAGAAQGRIEHVIGADQRAGVREHGLLARRMFADLDQQYRLAARRGAQRAHEAAGVLDAFDIEEDVLGTRVGDHVVEHFAEVDVAFGTEGNNIGEADLVGQRPVEDRGAKRAGLRYEADGAGVGAAVGKGQVELAAGTHDAQAVGADQAHAVAAGVFECRAFQRAAAWSGFGESAGNDDGVLAAGAAAGLHDFGHGLGPGADHGDVESLRNGIDRGVGLLAEHGFMLRIDEEEFAFVARVEHVAHQRDTDRIGGLRGADDGYRVRLEQGVQVVLLVMHGGTPQVGGACCQEVGAVQQKA